MSGGDSGAKSPAPSGASKKLGTLGLAAIVLSSMVGGGIFSLPQNMAAGAAAGAVIIAWIITGIGVYFIADTFRILSAARPDLTAGIYMYSRDGFGNYAGFTIAWGYWLCQIFGNVGYLWKLAAQGKLAGCGKTAGVCARRALVAGVAGSAFALWLIYAAGLEYLLASIIFLALGIPFYIWARRERGQKPFGKKDGFAAVCIAAVAATALALFASGKLGFGQASAPSAPPAAAAKHSPAAKKCVPPMSKRHGESVIIIEEQTEQITF